MNQEQKNKETQLKKKYDSSNMKEKMIEKYGLKKGKSIYFAYIRKLAMKENVIDEKIAYFPSIQPVKPINYDANKKNLYYDKASQKHQPKQTYNIRPTEYESHKRGHHLAIAHLSTKQELVKAVGHGFSQHTYNISSKGVGQRSFKLSKGVAMTKQIPTQKPGVSKTLTHTVFYTHIPKFSGVKKKKYGRLPLNSSVIETRSPLLVRLYEIIDNIKKDKKNIIPIKKTMTGSGGEDVIELNPNLLTKTK